ncbi:MAG: sigma-54-dependent Fis family transcriptional regulator [Colwellia sp.]|nr:sigma-54-dependent Fis family transcriptional regulator [Colwellia sp.]
MTFFSENLAVDIPLIVLVDDEVELLNALVRVLRPLNANIQAFDSPLTALDYCKDHKPEIVISDQKMPELEGCLFLEEIKKLWPQSQRIILSAHQDFDKISTAFNSGTVERFICKPWDNKELKFIINKILEQQPIESTGNSYKSLISEPINFHGIITADDAMKEIFVSIRHAATTNAPIFITGETGTGKELVAKACHQESYQKDQPFIAVNCANFSESLMESQLFGHTKGSFTGAISTQEGVFAAAKKGMLFLDEITTLSKILQAKLLRVVQEREFTPLGTNKVEKFNAQLVSASSNSLRQAVIDGDFREDLYYRLNVITFTLPPLRDREGDLIIIARYFLKKYNEIENKSFSKLSKGCIQIICQYDWPGNIRQLENVIHGMMILNTGHSLTSEMIIKALSTSIGLSKSVKSKAFIEHKQLPDNVENHNEVIPLWLVEKNAIESAISFCRGNIPQAAALLEVSPSTIYRKKQSW